MEIYHTKYVNFPSLVQKPFILFNNSLICIKILKVDFFFPFYLEIYTDKKRSKKLDHPRISLYLKYESKYLKLFLFYSIYTKFTKNNIQNLDLWGRRNKVHFCFFSSTIIHPQKFRKIHTHTHWKSFFSRNKSWKFCWEKGWLIDLWVFSCSLNKRVP